MITLNEGLYFTIEIKKTVVAYRFNGFFGLILRGG